MQNRFYVHRLVAAAFIPNPQGKAEVNHRSGHKKDNSAINLNWATREENRAHAVRLGLTAHGERQARAKLTSSQVTQIRYEMAGEKGPKKAVKAHESAQRYHVHPATIHDIVSGRTWKHLLPNQQHEVVEITSVRLKRSGGDDGQVDASVMKLVNGQPTPPIAA